MAIQLILGSSGSGKSHAIYHKIIEESMAHPDREYLVIVPEQFTMQTQKELVSMHPGHGILNIDVLSFQRLAYRVFEEVGGDSRRILEETGKTLVLEKVVQENRKQLHYLGNQMKKPGYIQEMKSLISELMQYDVQEKEMEEMLAQSQEKALLNQKMQDVQVLYDQFRSYLQERFLTGEEVLDVLVSKLELSHKIPKSTIVLDGFTGFTPIQYRVLERLMELCPMLYVTVTMGEQEKIHGKWKPFELFAMSKQMVHSLEDYAGKAHCEILEPMRVLPGENSRFSHSPALMHLEENLFRYGRREYLSDTREIQIFAEGNPLQEMTQVARRILRLIRQKQYRFGEIAVITGDLDTYGNYASQVFERMEIPYFIDRTHSVLMNPFVEYIRSALDVMQQNFSYESVFRHLRCGMGDLTNEEIDLLENYVIALGIRGWNRWKEKWIRLYRGMAPEEIVHINEIREKAMRRLMEFAEEFKKRGNTVADNTRALYQYIVTGKIQEKLKVQELEFARLKDTAMEREYAQIYGIVMSLLDKLVEILGEEKIGQRDYVQLVEAGLAESTVGIIPPSTDQILVGEMERTRLKDIKALFFVGVNDGIIPKNTGSGGILSDHDRDFFEKQGISMAPTPKEAMYMQRFYLYLNMTKPSEHLCLSYSLADASGSAMGPAYLIGTMGQMFPKVQVEYPTEGDWMDRWEHPSDCLNVLVGKMRDAVQFDEDDTWKEIYSWFLQATEYRSLLDRLTDAVFSHKPKDKISKAVADLLYGNISEHSATRLERFSACAFAHFLQYGLGLTQRVEYEFTPADMGNVVHHALEQFALTLKKEGLSWKDLTDEEREAQVEACLAATVDDYGNTILHSSARNEYMTQRVKRILNRTVWALQKQLQKGEFVPENFEVSIGGGRIDRLDTYEKKDRVYVKVIDYKTGNTKMDLLEIYYGLQMQLLIYLDGALEVEQRKNPGKEIVPAGVFYYQVKDPLIQEKIGADLSSMDEKILKELKLNGLVTSDKSVISAMDASMESLPVSQNKDGSFSRYSKVADQKQFGQLLSYIRRETGNIKHSIMDGSISIEPYELGKKNGCTYCPYSGICGFDQKIPGYGFRRLKQFSEEEIWKQLEEEEKDDGSKVDTGTTESH